MCGGAFTGLEKIISARSRSSSIGFVATLEDLDEASLIRDKLVTLDPGQPVNFPVANDAEAA